MVAAGLIWVPENEIQTIDTSSAFHSGLVALPSLALANQNAVSDHPLAVVGFGDSLMSGFRLPLQDSFTAPSWKRR